MADRHPGIASCDAVQDLLAELVLDVLAPEDALVVEQHVAGCSSCAAEVADLREVVDEVVASVPAAAPPPALLRRSVASHSALHARSGGPAVRGAAHGGERRRWMAVVAAAVALLAGALGGLSIGRGTADRDASHAALERVGVVEVRSGALVGPDGRIWGRVVVTGGSSPVLVMTVDRVRPGTGYGCAVRDQAGVLQTIGSWVPTHDDQRTWAADLGPTVAGTREVVMTGPEGRHLAVAQLS